MRQLILRVRVATSGAIETLRPPAARQNMGLLRGPAERRLERLCKLVALEGGGRCGDGGCGGGGCGGGGCGAAPTRRCRSLFGFDGRHGIHCRSDSAHAADATIWEDGHSNMSDALCRSLRIEGIAPKGVNRIGSEPGAWEEGAPLDTLRCLTTMTQRRP